MTQGMIVKVKSFFLLELPRLDQGGGGWYIYLINKGGNAPESHKE